MSVIEENVSAGWGTRVDLVAEWDLIKETKGKTGRYRSSVMGRSSLFQIATGVTRGSHSYGGTVYLGLFSAVARNKRKRGMAPHESGALLNIADAERIAAGLMAAIAEAKSRAK